MQALQELLANRVLISGLVGWGAAQVLKTIIYALMHRTLDLTRIFGDGLRRGDLSGDPVRAGLVPVRHQRDRGDHRDARRDGRPA